MGEIVKGDPQNNGRKAGKPKHSNFPLREHRQQTMRFAENTPHLVFNGVPDDFIKFISKKKVESYTLKAPLQAPIYMDCDYFYVTRMAILPLNYEEKCFKNPKIGDDVIEKDNVGTSVSGAEWTKLWETLANFLDACHFSIQNSTLTDAERTIALENAIKTSIMLENFFSYGGMFTAMGCNVETLMEVNIDVAGVTGVKRVTYDKYTHDFYTLIKNALSVSQGWFLVLIDGEGFSVTHGSEPRGLSNQISFREFLCKARQTNNWELSSINVPTGNTWNWSWVKVKPSQNSFIQLKPLEKPIDTARFWAYQLACAEYYTNDNVDYIYSAELFRQLIGNTVSDFESAYGTPFTFTYNGVSYRYDYLSAKYTKEFIEDLVACINNATGVNHLDYYNSMLSALEYFEYFTYMLRYTRSLKYRDYFVGGRVRPLAKGDINVNVTGGQFNVVDMAWSMQVAKYAQVLNKLKSGVKEYTEGIFGVKPKPDYHSPLWIGSTEDIVYGQEVENTGEAQQTKPWSVTATMKNQGKNKGHSVSFDRDAIIVGITHFDIERAYTNTIDRHFFHEDRYDRFNPYLQYTGDQELYKEEVNPILGSGVFAYKDAYSEFKQTYNKAMGGFVECLEGWAFLTDYNDPSIESPICANMRPEFIRAKQTELDKFYVHIDGDNLAYYFHFILNIENEINADRPMAVNPQLF